MGYRRQLHPSKFFSALQSYCSCLSVGLLSYDSRSTLIRPDRRKKFGRAARQSDIVQSCYCADISLDFIVNLFYCTQPTIILQYGAQILAIPQSEYTLEYPVQIFLSPPVVLLSFLSRFALVRQQIDSNTAGGLKKNWTATFFFYMFVCKKNVSAYFRN